MEEADKRFHYFTTQVCLVPLPPSASSILTYHDAKLLPKVLKSAVQSANTMVFIPSSFDFIRVHNYFRKMSGTSFTILSE